MKSKLNLSVSTAIGLLILGHGMVMAEPGGLLAPLTTPEATQAPVPVALARDSLTAQTGKSSREKWIDADWVDPFTTIKELKYDNLPASEIAQNLRELFKNQIDILIANRASDDGADPAVWCARFSVHDVKASEIFRAMNELLEAENSPFRWRLKMNGSRPMALFCSIPELASRPVAGAAVDPTTGLPMSLNQKKPMVFFVGDLIGDERWGGLSWEHLQTMLEEIEVQTYKQEIVTGFHKEAELVIVKGTDEQIAFIRDTLEALKARLQTEKVKYATAIQTKKPEETKTAPTSAAK
jgi:DNA-binding protein